jgi:hypothetical protein
MRKASPASACAGIRLTYIPRGPYGSVAPYIQALGGFRYVKARYRTPQGAWASGRSTTGGKRGRASGMYCVRDVTRASRRCCVVMTSAMYRTQRRANQRMCRTTVRLAAKGAVTPMTGSLRSQFSTHGFAVVRGLLPAPEVAFYTARLKELAGGRKRWTAPDGVNRHPDFWDVLFHERLLSAVREVLGPEVRYLPHNDLHLGFSSFSWHRDSVTREVGSGPDWNESSEPYRIARVGIYLQRFDDSGFRLGFVKGSHRAAHPH